jgi:hypothetical protein
MLLITGEVKATQHNKLAHGKICLTSSDFSINHLKCWYHVK